MGYFGTLAPPEPVPEVRRAIECAELRKAFWERLADEVEALDPERAIRLRGMAVGASYAAADMRRGTDPAILRDTDTDTDTDTEATT